MKEELGLDHFEGRSWRGFHHHAALVLLAYGFLTLERHRAAAEEKPVKKSRYTKLSLPAIRRALQLLLAPPMPDRCPHCQKVLRVPMPTERSSTKCEPTAHR